MATGTASNRLLKDLLFSLAVRLGYRCHHCAGELTRETLSIEHKVPWLNSPDPVALFFDLDNIGFSHLKCNISVARKPHKISDEVRVAYQRQRATDRARGSYTTERRREKHALTGH